MREGTLALPPSLQHLLASEAGRRSGPMALPTFRLFSGLMRRRFPSPETTFTRTTVLIGYSPWETRWLSDRCVFLARARARAGARAHTNCHTFAGPGPTLALRPWRSTSLEPRTSSRRTHPALPSILATRSDARVYPGCCREAYTGCTHIAPGPGPMAQDLYEAQDPPLLATSVPLLPE